MKAMKRVQVIALAVLAAAFAVGVTACGSSGGSSGEVTSGSIPSKPEAGVIKMGIEPWIGYGPWYIAEKEGFFDKQGIDVEIINFSTDSDREAAFVGGKTDVSNVPTQVALLLAQQQIPAKMVLLEDESLTADAILAKAPITSVKDLEGEKVAYEEGTTSDILLNYALEQEGMSISDIEKVPIPAANAGNAALAGQVGAAVTYQPYIAAVLEKDPAFEEIYAAKEDPGLISDGLMVSNDMIANKPGQVAALVRAWGEAVEFYEQHEKEAQEIITAADGAEPGSLATSFAGVKLYNLAENAELLPGEFVTKTAVDVSQAANNAGILEEEVDPSSVVEPAFVEAEK
ncbi:MAG TPA: ABC transporter substrate-binding protein [Solirubrobacterales bacterium]|nr:ABC transporter substrate-binding protein [Solirubrobacterales bacterium]